MGYCPNCKAHLTCSCQRRATKDGRAGCSNCIASLNAVQPKQTQPVPGTAPKNVSAVYTGPGKQT